MTRFRDLPRDQRERILDAGRAEFIRVINAVGWRNVVNDNDAMDGLCEAVFVRMSDRFLVEQESS
jgi:hypothetical protein